MGKASSKILPLSTAKKRCESACRWWRVTPAGLEPDRCPCCAAVRWFGPLTCGFVLVTPEEWSQLEEGFAAVADTRGQLNKLTFKEVSRAVLHSDTAGSNHLQVVLGPHLPADIVEGIYDVFATNRNTYLEKEVLSEGSATPDSQYCLQEFLCGMAILTKGTAEERIKCTPAPALVPSPTRCDSPVPGVRYRGRRQHLSRHLLSVH